MSVTNKILEATRQAMSQVDRKGEMEALVRKWEPSGLLQRLRTPRSRQMVSQLLENQAHQLIVESENSTNGGGSRDRENWNGIALPLVRRVFDSFSVKELISVQPMHQPSGLVFFLDFKYGSSIGRQDTGYGADTEPSDNKNLNSLFGIVDIQDTDAAGGFYGAGRFSYTNKPYVTAKLSTGSLASGVALSSTTLSDFNYDTVFSASVWRLAPTKILKLQISASKFDEPDLLGVRSFMVSSSGVAIKRYYPEYTSYNQTTKVITFIVSSSISTAWASQTVSSTYKKQPTSTTRGDFEARGTSLTANPEVDIQIPELDIEFRSETIVAETKKLKAQWTMEFASDISAYQGIDAELELTSTMTTIISSEIDMELLEMLYAGSRTTDYWSARIGFVYNGSNGFVSGVPSAGTSAAYVQSTWFSTLGTKIQKVSNKIHQKTMRGDANWIVVSPNVATILESIPGYITDTDGSKRTFGMGVQRVGSFSNRWTVYKNPYLTTNRLLLGYRGSSFLDTGAAYCPYIPLMTTPVVLDPKNFTPRKGVVTRYAKKLIRGEFFGSIYTEGIETI